MPNLMNEMTGLMGFVRTVEAGSFSAAARDMGTTPSAVSKSVARLEAVVESRLFLRSTRALSLTPDGHVLFEKVAPLLKELDNSGDVIQKSELSGRLRLSLPSELARLLMEPLFGRFAKANPDLHLDIGITDRRVDLVREDLDVVFRVGDELRGDLTVRRLASLEMILVASPDFLAKHGFPINLQELTALPFARYSSGGKALPIKFADGAEIVPRPAIDADSGHALRAAALYGIGVAYLMKCVVADDLVSGRLLPVMPGAALPEMPFSALHAFRRIVPARVRVLSDFIGKEVRALTV
jgi:DNA-binding transcriptional LysR family regulator